MKATAAHLSGRYILKLIALGALLAGGIWAVQGPPGSKVDGPELIITETDVAHQAARWERMWGRVPTTEELRQAVDGYIRNEILYREALARGMDREDPRVRLALIQKMQMMAAGQADARSIGEDDLAAFFALRKEQYRIPARISLIQVFFREDTEARSKAANLRAQFNQQEPSEAALGTAGDPTLLDLRQEGLTATELEKQFGTDFTAEVLSLAEGVWAGPVRSGYGLHVVKVVDRQPGRIPDLAEVRNRVENDLRYETSKAAQEQSYQEIASKYRVAVSDRAGQMLRGDPQ